MPKKNEMKTKNRRWRLIADTRFQGQLCLRVCAYWIVCQMALITTLSMLTFLGGNDGVNLAGFSVPAFTISLLFLPVVLYDLIKFSNRFVGPIANIRNSVEDSLESGNWKAIKLRDGDQLQELASMINQIGERREAETESAEFANQNAQMMAAVK